MACAIQEITIVTVTIGARGIAVVHVHTNSVCEINTMLRRQARNLQSLPDRLASAATGLGRGPQTMADWNLVCVNVTGRLTTSPQAEIQSMPIEVANRQARMGCGRHAWRLAARTLAVRIGARKNAPVIPIASEAVVISPPAHGAVPYRMHPLSNSEIDTQQTLFEREERLPRNRPLVQTSSNA